MGAPSAPARAAVVVLLLAVFVCMALGITDDMSGAEHLALACCVAVLLVARALRLRGPGVRALTRARPVVQVRAQVFRRPRLRGAPEPGDLGVLLI